MLYIPKIKRNLLSITAITDQGHVVKFTKTGVEILNDGGKVIRHGVRRNNLYELSALTTSTGVGTTKLWHERFGHIGHAVLKEMHKHGMVAHLPVVTEMKEPCEACMLGKQQRKAFPLESTNRAKVPLELVHADLCGKMPTQALGDLPTLCCSLMILVGRCGSSSFMIRLKHLVGSKNGYSLLKMKQETS